MRERDVIARLRRMATAPEARGLLDDVAILDGLVLTHDSIAEGVHYLPFDPPASVGWKLVAVNLSDLAAKGARPRAALLSLAICGDGEWEEAFLGGIEAACEAYGLDLIGGDTIALPPGASRVLGLTAIGTAGDHVPARTGGQAGDSLWLVGTLGDSAAGLAQLLEDRRAQGPLVDIYRRPIPQIEAGRLLAPRAHAMMDVSDGLFLELAPPGRGQRLFGDDRARFAAVVRLVRRGAKQFAGSKAVRGQRGRRLCLARGLSRRPRSALPRPSRGHLSDPDRSPSQRASGDRRNDGRGAGRPARQPRLRASRPLTGSFHPARLQAG